ncbi:MAG: hypothetical protein COT73_00030 [Bdellovibrio sp. CG10_big_fil_rev_8_21_14_0_10_47_8]|nr:MAG: hypothetical protein COT73_00030 [Bdellovibrio sp. CG10_big_fil_rev_8_21_14_0_10_47_8]
MEFGKVQYFERVETKHHREFIQAHNNCILCSSVLELRHIRTDEALEIKEEAYCPQCDLRTRAKNYTMN